MREPLLAAHVALSALILLWDVAVAARIARKRNAPRPFAFLSALVGLLIAPALLVAVASASTLFGRALQATAWIWPAVIVLAAVQALWAASRRLVAPLVAAPIALYNILLAANAIAVWLVSRGADVPDLLLALRAADASALALAASPTALGAPFIVHVPMLSPALHAQWRLSLAFRAVLAAVAAGWSALILSQLPVGRQAIASYAAYADALIQERPEGDFRVGVRLFPPLGGGPPPLALRNDLATADTLRAGVVAVVLSLDGATPIALDSLARSLEELRRGGARLVVALGYPRELAAFARPPRPLDRARRLRAVERIARRLRPHVLLPADEPYGVARRAVGTLPVEVWQQYLADAARVTKSVDRRIRVGVAASSFGPRDSTLYAWAASPGSPLDVVGFDFQPSRAGARGLEAQLAAAERWMRAARSPKDHWVFSASGYPVSHGELAQERALWRVLAWATNQASVHAMIVGDAGDYDRMYGLRAPDGRLRRATFSLARAIQRLRDPLEAQETPAPGA
jgi:hypothetical protein